MFPERVDHAVHHLAIFVAACGVTRLLSIYTVWVPAYEIEALAKAFPERSGAAK